MSNRPLRPASRRGFTLVEALVVLAVVAIAIVLMLPTVRTPRHTQSDQCLHNLKQIAQALAHYEQEYKAFPPAFTVDAAGQPLHSWRTLILPYLWHEDVYRSIDLAKPWDDPANAKAAGARIDCYICPSARETRNATTYLAVVGPDACLLPGRSRRRDEITDGPSNTLVVIEAAPEDAVPWMAPRDADGALVQSLRSRAKPSHAGVNAAFVDGSIHFLKTTIAADVLHALTTIAGKEDVNADDY